LKSFRADVRQRIKKAKAQGLTTEIRQDPEAIDIFWRLHLATRKRQGVPIQPRGYFSLFHKHIIARNLGFVALAQSGGQYACGGVFCAFNGVVTYKYGASDPEYRYLSPTHLMLWETMLYAREGGLSKFDFGKTEVSNAGLRMFKAGWNSKEMELKYSYFPAVPSGRLFEMLNTRVVRPVIRRSPAFVCQAAGEVLYRFFGG
jgi:lipid II:glycine glycyltransferase (peptidoglycan interpeptide bridge formation enzyme)